MWRKRLTTPQCLSSLPTAHISLGPSWYVTSSTESLIETCGRVLGCCAVDRPHLHTQIFRFLSRVMSGKPCPSENPNDTTDSLYISKAQCMGRIQRLKLLNQMQQSVWMNKDALHSPLLTLQMSVSPTCLRLRSAAIPQVGMLLQLTARGDYSPD